MATTARGHIEQLPSGSFRVHVYAGADPVTGKPRRLKQTCRDEASAAAALGKLLAQADGDHFPNREATLGQALGKYLEVADLEVSTREAHEGYIRRTIGPVLGEVKIRKLGVDSLDSLYTALKKCSRLCRRLPRTEHHTDGEHACDGRCSPLRDHRTTRPHACDSRCRPHACQPMKPATILRVHSIISSALDLAVRYDWADRNIAKNASPPHPRKREPDPPSPDQAARLLNLVWAEDEEFGLSVDRVHDRGPPRRGERATREPVRLREPAGPPGPQLPGQAGPAHREGAQGRRGPRPVPGPADLRAIPRAVPAPPRRVPGSRRPGARRRVRVLSRPGRPRAVEPRHDDAPVPPVRPPVGITSSLKELRHYSATQLLAAGTDLNTVAGRLGHAEGSTTLKFYVQFTRPADRAAAIVIPSQLDGLRKKERLRELYSQHLPASDADQLAALAAVIGPQAGLDESTALACLTEFISTD
jgi:hypothetical protein